MKRRNSLIAIAAVTLSGSLALQVVPSTTTPAAAASPQSVGLSTKGTGATHIQRHPQHSLIRRAGTTSMNLRNLHSGRLHRRERTESVAPLNPNWDKYGGTEHGIVDVPAQAAPAPPPTTSFDGLDYATWGAGHPPDTNGDVGPTYYIQTVNTSIGIYQKSTGSQVAAFTFDAFMSLGSFGNLCDTDNFGDPVVLYDSFEDRWVVTDFAFQLNGSGDVVNPPGAFECFAVSKTGNPVAGGWNYYSVNTAGGLGDYPKLGIWPDGIYMSVNMFDYVGSAFQDPRVYALNKAQMYAGKANVQVVSFDAPSTDFALLPSNARLQTGTPPPGTPNYFVSTWDFLNAVNVYKFHVDWARPSTSTFTGPDSPVAGSSWPNASVPNAPSPVNSLDVLQIRAMAQNQYSNLGGSESLWFAHTVHRGTVSGAAAPRYYQANVTGGTVAANLVQAATWDPDGNDTMHRFMPSVAVDHAGDMAMGYSTSNAVTNPAIKYAGRLAGDPVNTFSQTEQTLIQGTGTQSGNCGASACTRWGDYSSMTLDPDGCTFWYTSEYYAVTGLNDQTRIGSFSFPGCATVGPAGTLAGTVTEAGSGTPLAGASVTLGSRTTTTAGDGTYSFTGLPSGVYPTLGVSEPGYVAGSASSIAVPSGSTATRDFGLALAGSSGSFVDNTQPAFQYGTANNVAITNGSGVILAALTGVNQQNTTVTNSGFGFTNTSWAGQTFTPSVSGALSQVDLDLFCSGCSGTNPNISVSIRATTGSPAIPTGPDLATATITGFNDNAAGGYHPATFASPVQVTAGTRYALAFRSVAARTGVYAYLCSCATSGAVNSNPYANGQRVTSSDSGSSWTADLTVGGRDLGFKTYVDQGYAPTGTFVSGVKDANPISGSTPGWNTVNWNASTPAGTSVTLQAAGSDSPDGPFTFVGPDGTSGTTFSNGGSLAQFNGKRYLQYRATLASTDSTQTPQLLQVSVSFANGSGQTISFTGAPATATYGASFPVSASATSGLPVTVTSSGACSNVGTTVTMTSGTGTCSLTASQPGDASHSPAPDAHQSTTATKAAQTVGLTVPASKVYGDASFPVSGTATSGLAVTLGVGASDPCTLSSGSVTITGAGTCTVTGDQAGDSNYAAAPTASSNITIGKAGQTITFPALADATYGDAPIAVSASSTSGLPVSFGAVGPCTVNGGSVTITGAGSCTVTASQAGNGNYNAASDVPRLFTIAKATASLDLSGLNPTYDGSPKAVTVTTTPSGLTGVTVTYDGSPTAPTSGGSYAVHAELANANYAADPVNGTLVIAPAAQSIDFASLADRTFGAVPFDVSATATSGLPVTFGVGATDNCTMSGHTVTLTGAGSCTVTASQSGAASYQAADPVARTFSIGKGAAVLQFGNLDQTYDGTARPVNAGTTPTGLSGVTVTYDGGSAVPVSAGSYAVHASLTNANYTATPIDNTLVVHKASQSISFPPLAGKHVGDADFTVSATATSGLAVTFSVGATDACTITGALVHLTGAGSCTVTAAQAGDANRAAAADVPNSFAITTSSATLALSNLTQVYNGQPRNVTVTTNPPGLQTVATTYDGSSTAPTNAGSYAVHVTLTNPAYSAAPKDDTFVIQKAQQVITFAALPDRNYGTADFTVTATSSRSLPVQFVTTGVCTVTGAVVHLTGAGTCAVTASQPGNGNIAPAASVKRTFTVNPAPTKTTVSVSPTSVKTGGHVTLTAHVSPTAIAGSMVTGKVKFSIAGTSAGTATVANGVAKLSGVHVTAAPGSRTVLATFVSGRPAVGGSSGTRTLTVTHR